MSGDAQNIIKEDVHECSFISISVRGWLAIILTGTVCLLSGFGVEIKEPLYSLAIMALGFYFAKSTTKQ